MATVNGRGNFPRWRRTIHLLARRAATPLCTAILLSQIPCNANIAADDSLKFRIQAVFILNFTRFIEWPPESLGPPSSPFNICVPGADPLVGALDQTVAGETVRGHQIHVLEINGQPAPGLCRILYYGAADYADGPVFGAGRGVLTVGEGERFAARGGMIGFVLNDGRVSFDINRRPADAAGLTMSSRLLAVARSVTQ